MVRLKDIAEKVGVSVMTVSRVLRNSPDISEQTRQKVLKAAWEMGYVPDATARGLRTRTTLLVGIALPSLNGPWVGPLLETLEASAEENRRELLVVSSKLSSERQESAVDRLLSRRVEGIWLMPLPIMQRPVNLYQRISRQNVQLVYIGVADPEHAGAKAVFDFTQQLDLAVKHLVDLGHKKIGFVSGPAQCLCSQQRQKAFESATAKYLGSAGPIIEGGMTAEDAQRAAETLVSQHRDLTGVVVDTDPLAIELIRALKTKGIDVPGKLSVVGWGDWPESAGVEVPLTTVHAPWDTLAQKAAQIMQALLNKEGAEDAIIPGELVVRKSTAAP